MARIGVYICHCGLNIAGVVDVEGVAEYANHLPEVEVAKHHRYLCSVAGQKLIKEDIKTCKLNRVVVASCSPRMHEPTFRNAISEAGLNPYLLEMINIREQDSWVHSDSPEKATEKAKALIAMAVGRVSRLAPLEKRKIKAEKSVLVIGGGIAGIQASLDLAETGFKVTLVEKTASIGGRMAQLDKTFSTLDCSACILTPRMAEVGRHPNIELLTNSQVEELTGFVGNFEATILTEPSYIDLTQCTGCGECADVCPVSMLDEFDLGLKMRKAVFRPFPQAVPNVFTIDKRGIPACRATCPAGVNVQGYIALASQGKFIEAYELIKKANPFPSVCGRVCFRPCETECERGKLDDPIAINAIKRFVADYARDHKTGKQDSLPEKYNERVAVIGSGPAGLTVAYDLKKLGYPVTVFEAHPQAGGMLRVGIPEYRLPKVLLDEEIQSLINSGIEILTGITIGKDKSIDELLKQYQAIFIATGIQICHKLGIKGESYEGVIPALEFLKQINFHRELKIGKKVAVIGGGNVAIDAARCALRKKAEQVLILYRRSREEMPAYPSEVEEAEREGAELHLLVSPKRILGQDGCVTHLECIRMTLGEPDESGRRRPVPIEGSEFLIEVDMIIPAVGQSIDKSVLPDNLKLTPNETIMVDSNTLKTNLDQIFAGGDAVTGEATVIDAIAQGKQAAKSIDCFLKDRKLEVENREELKVVRDVSAENVESKTRKKMPLLPLDKRTDSREVELGFTEEMVLEEAKRCLMCAGCSECLECEKVCELPNVINHHQKEARRKIRVGSVIVAVGCEIFDASQDPALGYGVHPNVVSNIMFERMSNAGGPTNGKILNPLTGKPPKTVTFIQCVGSRDKRFSEQCCRIGCMVTLKQAILLKEKMGEDINVFVCYNDMRSFGKGYEEFYDRARTMGIKFIKGLPSEVKQVSDGSLIFDVYESNTQKLLEIHTDLIVLASGLIPGSDFAKLQQELRISRSPDGFFLETHPKLQPLETATRGIFLAGACQSPKDIPDTVAQASGAAMKVAELLASGEVDIEPLVAVVDENLCCGCRICVSVCPYQAIEMKTITEDSEKREVASVLPAVCQGCGACSVACPTAAVDMQHYMREQIMAQITSLIQGGQKG